MYTARAIANYFLERSESEGIPLDPLKIQKLVYFAHGWNLAIHGAPLVNERVEAWNYGPVFPSLYHEFKRFGRQPIDTPAFDWVEGEAYAPTVPERDRTTRSLLGRIWEVYSPSSGKELSNMTHQKGGPWAETWENEARRGAIRGVDIPEDQIESYFRQVGLESRG